ncbi:MAG: dephospho-CoA kinase [Acidimicrobiales bacterium]
MIVVGLTGGIGSGKSAVAARLAARGAVVIDADDVAHEVVQPGRRGFTKVVERFGPAVVAPDGEIDRAQLAAIVFNDREALSDLEAIVHPAVWAEITARLASLWGGDDIVVLDIPLLVESGGRDRYGLQAVIVVDTPVGLAVERLVQERRMDRSAAEARIARQASREERLAQADFVISNVGTPDDLDASVAAAWEWMKALQALGTGGRGAGTGSPR